ncbi:beta-galactosidase [Planoprotostelium fungivorum]|uniref:Beta-galactosidase n=1 Tax=Planoprotostelium fungivorum TaxID=1890364 RepID=A0A2P6NM72_9EUKA|nr:beta-galactosidase [Planoprotostelium fungivorum]
MGTLRLILLSCIFLSIFADRSFVISGDSFVKDGEPYVIISGSVHYFRIPQALWPDRLLKMRAGGLNTITTYVPWNLHNPQPGQYNFEGRLDLLRFLLVAQKAGLNVILRTSPYICAEFEMGGLPAWLLNVTGLELRSSDPAYLSYYATFMDVLAPKLKPLLYSEGGNIIAIQIENEYGWWGTDLEYQEALLQQFIERNIRDVIFFQCDPNYDSTWVGGGLPSLLRSVNMAASAPPQDGINWLRERQSSGPILVSEMWDGWFDYWEAANIQWLLSRNISISLYMYHGGTNFDYTAGFTITTSYDYDGALNESGDPTYKFEAFKNSILSVFPQDLPQLPPAKLKGHYGDVIMTSSYVMDFDDVDTMDRLSIWGRRNRKTVAPKPMEYFGQNNGFILYRARVPGPQKDSIQVNTLHDRAHFYQDGNFIGTYFRNNGNLNKFKMNVTAIGSTLDLFVENMGRINTGHAISSEYKGIVDSLQYNGKNIYHWDSWSFDFSDISTIPFTKGVVQDVRHRPVFYEGTFEVVDTPLDTFASFANWTKGFMWVNGNNIGRYWNVGPQERLYIPSPFLKTGLNRLVVLELDATNRTVVSLMAEGNLGPTAVPILPVKEREYILPEGNRLKR